MSDENAVETPAAESPAPARSSVPLVTPKAKADLPPVGDGTIVPKALGSEVRGQTAIEGDDGLLRSPLCVHFSQRPEGVPVNFYNPKHNFVDIGAMGKSWEDTRAELERMRAEFRAPESYALTDTATGFFGAGADPDKLHEVAAQHPMVQQIAAVASTAKLSQKQFAAVVDAFLDITVGESFTREQEQAYVQANGGDELRAGQRLAAISTRARAMYAEDGSDREVANNLMKTAAGRRFLENHMAGKYNQYLSAPVSRGDVAAQHTRAISLAELKQMQASKEYLRGDPIVRQKVENGYKALYGDRVYEGGRD